MSIEVLFEMVNQWGGRTFTKATPESCMAHLRRELVELGDALKLENPMELQSTREEVADCFILFVQVLGRMGVDFTLINLEDEVSRKLAINASREWGEPDSEGVVEHVRDNLVRVRITGGDQVIEGWADLNNLGAASGRDE